MMQHMHMYVIPFFKGVNHLFYPMLVMFLIFRWKISLIGFVVLILVVHIIKICIQRERPDNSDHLSFPSGHSASAWFIVPLYDWNPIVAIWATLISTSRVVLSRHYITDVVAGGIIGTAIGIIAIQTKIKNIIDRIKFMI